MNIDVLTSTITINFVLAWAALFSMLRWRRVGLIWWPIFLWLCHQTVFLSVVFLLQLTNNYEGPSWLFTTWSSIIRMQILISVIGYAYVVRRG